MKKTLVTRKNLDDFLHDNCIYVSGEMILTPGAKDAIREKNYELVYGIASCKCEVPPVASVNTEVSLEDKIKEILVKEYKIENGEKLEQITSIVTKIINSF